MFLSLIWSNRTPHKFSLISHFKVYHRERAREMVGLLSSSFWEIRNTSSSSRTELETEKKARRGRGLALDLCLDSSTPRFSNSLGYTHKVNRSTRWRFFRLPYMYCTVLKVCKKKVELLRYSINFSWKRVFIKACGQTFLWCTIKFFPFSSFLTQTNEEDPPVLKVEHVKWEHFA